MPSQKGYNSSAVLLSTETAVVVDSCKIAKGNSARPDLQLLLSFVTSQNVIVAVAFFGGIIVNVVVCDVTKSHNNVLLTTVFVVVAVVNVNVVVSYF